MLLQPLWQRELFSGPHCVRAFYRSPSPPPPPAQAVGDLQGSEVKGREERQAFLLSFSLEWKGKCLCARKCQERIDWREKSISVHRDMHIYEYFKIQWLHPVQMLNLKAKYITLTLLFLSNRLQPQFFFSSSESCGKWDVSGGVCGKAGGLAAELVSRGSEV